MSDHLAPSPFLNPPPPPVNPIFQAASETLASLPLTTQYRVKCAAMVANKYVEYETAIRSVPNQEMVSTIVKETIKWDLASLKEAIPIVKRTPSIDDYLEDAKIKDTAFKITTNNSIVIELGDILGVYTDLVGNAEEKLYAVVSRQSYVMSFRKKIHEIEANTTSAKAFVALKALGVCLLNGEEVEFMRDFRDPYAACRAKMDAMKKFIDDNPSIKSGLLEKMYADRMLRYEEIRKRVSSIYTNNRYSIPMKMTCFMELRPALAELLNKTNLLSYAKNYVSQFEQAMVYLSIALNKHAYDDMSSIGITYNAFRLVCNEVMLRVEAISRADSVDHNDLTKIMLAAYLSVGNINIINNLAIPLDRCRLLLNAKQEAVDDVVAKRTSKKSKAGETAAAGDGTRFILLEKLNKELEDFENAYTNLARGTILNLVEKEEKKEESDHKDKRLRTSRRLSEKTVSGDLVQVNKVLQSYEQKHATKPRGTNTVLYQTSPNGSDFVIFSEDDLSKLSSISKAFGTFMPRLKNTLLAIKS